MKEAQSHWFQYFPESWMWSQGVGMAIELIPFGAAAMGEIDRVGRRLKERIGDNEAWFDEWTRMGEELERKAKAEVEANHQLSAGTYYLHASSYYGFGERYLHLGEKKSAAYARHLRCFEEGVKRRYPNMERVRVPYEGTTLPAWFMKGHGASGRTPTVVICNGLDGSKEGVALYAGVEIVARGVNALVFDGPGQGEALRLQNIISRYDFEVAGTAMYDYVIQRPDVDPKRVAIGGVSMGGYLAPRAAAFEPRYAACVAWGGHYDYHESWIRRIKEMAKGGTLGISAPHFHLMWILGVDDMDAAMEKLKKYTLEGVAQNIKCPVLITHGENDTVVSVEYAKRLYAAIGSEKKTLKIFTTEEGGCEHCQGDNRMLGANYVADWVADNL